MLQLQMMKKLNLKSRLNADYVNIISNLRPFRNFTSFTHIAHQHFVELSDAMAIIDDDKDDDKVDTTEESKGAKAVCGYGNIGKFH